MNDVDTTTAVRRSAARRLLRWLALVLASLFLLVLLLISALTAALSTDRSSQWLLGTVTELLSSETLQLHYDWYEGSFARGLTLHQLSIQLGENRITMERLHSQWNPYTLLGGQFNLDTLHVHGLQVDWQSDEEDPSATSNDEPFDLSALLDSFLPLPIAIRLADFALDEAVIRFDDQQIDIAALHVTASLNQHQLTVETLHLDAMDARLDASLQLALQGNYILEMALDWAFSDLATGQLELDGDLNAMNLRHQLADPAILLSQGELTLGVADLLNNQLAADASLPLTIDLQHSLESTTLNLAALAGLELPAATIHTQGDLTQLSITGSAGIRLNEPLPMPGLSAEAEWRLQLLEFSQLNIDSFALLTDSGQIEASGQLDWQSMPRISLEVMLAESDPAAYLGDFPEALALTDISAALGIDITLDEDGPRGSLELHSLTLLLNGNNVDADARIALAGELLDIDSLALRAGSNQLQFTGQLQDFSEIRGQLQLAANNLGELYPSLQGQMQADVALSGSLPLPLLDISLEGANLGYDNIRLAALRISGSASSNSNDIELGVDQLSIGDQTIDSIRATLDGNLEAHQLSLNVLSDLASMALQASGGVSDNIWRGELVESWFDGDFGRWQQSTASDLLLSAEDLSLAQTCWQQNGSRLCLNAGLDGSRQLQAALSLEDYPLSVLNGSRANSLLRTFHNGSLPEFLPPPAGLQSPFTLPEEVALIGSLSLQAEASGPLDDLDSLQINANVAASDTALYLQADLLPEDDDDDFVDDNTVEQFHWPELWATVRLDNGNWQVQSQMELLQHDRTDSGEALRGLLEATLNMDATQQLDGELTLDFDGMGWLAALTPQLQNPRGRIRGGVSIGGSFDTPTFDADVAVEDAGMTVVALGLPIEDISLRLRGNHTANVTLQASARSGDGDLSIDALIERPLEDSRRLQMVLQGSNFRVANLPELSAAISPDLRITASNAGINTTGTLRIPLLDATVTELPETAVDVSSDAVVVAQREEREPVRNAAQGDLGPLADIPISANVRVILGDRVRFAAFGLNARLSGQLDINQRPGSAPLAYGELQVAEGSFETYGRVLNIEQGQLLFFGPLDNPGLDIRAVRRVEEMRVGVQMSGTLRNIRSNLFSTPTLPDADILAVMITGRPLAELGTQQDDSNALIGAITTLGISQGQGLTDQVRGQLGLDTLALESSGDVQDSSLTLGKYITPRIFIRYAVGLFETESVLGIDYSITDNIKLEAKSGQYQSVDLTYTLER